MSDISNHLKTLIRLGKLDSLITQSTLEKKALELKLEERRAGHERSKREIDRREKEIVLRKREVDQVERRLKDEQLKLVERRRALATFSNYKLQQAAAREIENSGRQISEQESGILGEMDAIEKMASELAALSQAFQESDKEFVALAADTHGTIETLDSRIVDKQSERSALLQDIDKKLLNEYARVQHKHPQDPIVPLIDNKCSGCHMNMTAQISVQLAKGDALVRCRGCGRILYLENQDRDSQESGKQGNESAGSISPV
jgi:predicted  nucleic acid-binding Zn-ribbon protein